MAHALDGRGKRAAFALYYAPRHYLLVRAALDAVATASAAPWRPDCIVDLGCGTGVAGAAWSAGFAPPVAVVGVDSQAWTLDESRITYRDLGIPGRTVRSPIERLRWPRGRLAIVAAFTVNELDAPARARLGAALGVRATAGDAILVVEPLAKHATPWWPEWTQRFAGHGLDPRDLGCRCLWVPPPAAAVTAV